MIREVTPSEATQVFDLMGKVYASHSFLAQGLEAYIGQLEAGRYVSLGKFDGKDLQAHAGFRVARDFALINALVVDPGTRGSGLGRAIFDTRMNYIKSNHSFDFVVGYSMMQHLRSQSLYAEGFKPIGLDIGYPDIYHQSDSEYNRGMASNAELVLCQRLSDRKYPVELSVASRSQKLAGRILETMGVDYQFTNRGAEPSDSEIFLGFHPDTERGLFTPAYLEETATVDFAPLLASNQERQNFVDVIKGQI